MKKFKFRLEQILRYRNAVKEEKKRELITRNSTLKEGEDRIEFLEDERIRNAAPEGTHIPVEQFLLVGSYVERMKREIEAQREKNVELQAEVDKALQEYVAASKEAKVLEKLRARKEQQYLEWANKEEEKNLDENNVQRSARKILDAR